MSSPLLKEWFVSLSFQSIVSMYRGLASMEKTVDHCNIFVDELDCKLVLVFYCKHGEERERVKEREREKERQTYKDRDKSRKRERQKGKKRERQEKK